MRTAKYFSGKVVWISGASSGIGEQLAILTNKSGATVIISSRNFNALNLVKTKCLFSEKVHPISLDISQPDMIQPTVDQIVEQFGRIDVLINNAGISQRSRIEETGISVDRKLMEINYFGTITLTKSILPIMKQQRSGHIATVSSLTGQFGFHLRSAYAASKHALKGFFETLELEHSEINVTLVYPGLIKTDISLKALNGDGEAHNKMDNHQSNGMSAQSCAKKILSAIAGKQKETVIGGKETLLVYIKRFWPALFWELAKKQSGTGD